MKTGWDGWSRVYPFLEGAFLGRTLAQARRAGCGGISAPSQVLLLGDGDGRFLAHALSQWPEAEFVSIDGSAEMLAQSRARNSALARQRVTWIEGRVPEILDELGDASFDLVCTQFFLDCFTDGELADLWPVVAQRVRLGGLWSVVDFSCPEALSGWKKWRQRCLLRLLYTAFGLTTGLRARHLADFEAPFRNAGWRQESGGFLSGGLYRRDLWRKDSFVSK